MINRVILVGRLTRDPAELRRSASNVAVTSFTVAVDNRFARGEERSADFFNCVVFNKTAEFVELYCKKGSLVGIEGRLQSRSYDDKDGKRVYVVEVVCDSVQLLESKSVSEQRTVETPRPQVTTYPKSVTQDVPSPYTGIDIADDDLPF